MQQITTTLKIVSIQHELALNIGTDLNLDIMLEHFMRVLQRRLSLSKVHVFICPSAFKLGTTHKGLHYLKVPQANGAQGKSDSAIHDILIQSSEYLANEKYHRVTQPNLLKQNNQTNTHFYTFELGKVGWIILERLEMEIDGAVLNSLLTIFDRLSLSCIACLQHKSLLDEIEQREEVEKTLKQQAYLDPLTGLANRKMLYQQLRKELSSANRHNTFGSVFYFDIDRFKNINDTLGHAIGDTLLLAITALLKDMLRAEDVVARVGGDEFVILSPNLADNLDDALEASEKLAARLLKRFEQPLQLQKHNVRTSVSIGIALFPVDGFRSQVGSKHSEQLVHNADIAMYQVKSENRNAYRLYDPSMHQKAERHANVEKLLAQAIAKNELEIYCQPIVNKHEHIVAAEALLRWQNPQLGFVSPDEFIPIAEESGHIVKIGQFVIEQVCKTIQVLQQCNCNFDYISINISPRQFQDDGFVNYIVETLKQYKVPASSVKLEITEGLAISGMDETIGKMNQLIRHGFLFLLDDFGTGYSSLSYVHKLPLDTVKIDKSFISNISEHIEHQVIANAIIDIAERLNIGCIAEGAENNKDIEYLKDKRITGMQGYYYFKPLPRNKFIELLTPSLTLMNAPTLSNSLSA